VFVGLEPTRLIELTVGGVRSITHEYDDVVDFEPDTAFTWNWCDPAANGPYGFDPDIPGPPQPVKAAPSTEHWKVTDCVSVNWNVPEVTFVGLLGFTVIDGAGGPDSANATAAATSATARTTPRATLATTLNRRRRRIN
jgi:hypothetical protein